MSLRSQGGPQSPGAVLGREGQKKSRREGSVSILRTGFGDRNKFYTLKFTIFKRPGQTCRGHTFTSLKVLEARDSVLCRIQNMFGHLDSPLLPFRRILQIQSFEREALSFLATTLNSYILLKT